MTAPSLFGSRTTTSEDETRDAGRALAAALGPGQIVSLTGPLGAGKTVFVRGLAEGLGLDPRAVHSPTFAMVTEYGPSPGGLRLVHVDLYRIDRAAEIEDLGLDGLTAGGAVMAVEWGEKLPPRLRAAAVSVEMADAGGDRRGISIARPAARGAGGSFPSR